MAEHFTGHTDPKQAAEAAKKAADAAEQIVNGLTQAGADRERYGGHRDHYRTGPDASKSSSQDGSASSGTYNKYATSQDYGKAHISEQHSGLTPSGRDKISIQSRDGQSYGGAGLKTTTTEGNGVGSVYSGNYNTGHVDKTALANAAIESIENQYSDTDAAHAVRGYNRASDVANMGQIGRAGAKIRVEDSVYKNIHNTNLKNYKYVSTDDINNIVGGKYITIDNRTNNVMSDYSNNIHVLEDYLGKYNINAAALSQGEISRAIKEGGFKSSWFHGNGVDFGKLSEDESQNLQKVLAELHYLKGQKSAIDRMHGAGGFKNTAATWASELYGDSDVAKGYQISKATYNTAKTGLKAGKGIAGVGVNAALTATQLGEKVLVYGQDGVAKAMLKNAKSAEAKQKWKAVDEAAKAHIKAIDSGARQAAKQKVRYVVKTDGKRKIRDGARLIMNKTGLSNTKGVKAASAALKSYKQIAGRVQKKLAGNVVSKVLRMPFKAFSAVNLFVKKFLIIAGGIVLGLVIVDGVLLGLMMMFYPTGSETEEGHTGYSAEDCAQMMVNYLEDYNVGYFTNIYKCDGGENAKYGLPLNWELDDLAAPGDDAIICTKIGTAIPSVNSKTEIKSHIDGTKISGYYLKHYWGPGVGEIPSLEPVVYDWHYDDETGEKVYDKAPMTLTHVIGAVGTLGDKDLGEYENDISQRVKKDSPCYQENGHHDYDKLEVVFTYHGSEYSYQYTPTTPHTSEYYTIRDEEYMDVIYYDMEQMYKGFVGAALSFCGNEDENPRFWMRYGKQLFQCVMEHAHLSLRTTLNGSGTYDVDTGNVVKWKFYSDRVPEMGWQECEGYALKKPEKVKLVVDIDDCGIQDMMYLSEFIHLKYKDLDDYTKVYLKEHFGIDETNTDDNDKIIKWPKYDPKETGIMHKFLASYSIESEIINEIYTVNNDFAHTPQYKIGGIGNDWFAKNGSITKYVVHQGLMGIPKDPEHYVHWWGWYADGDPDYVELGGGFRPDGIAENNRVPEDQLMSDSMMEALDYYEMVDIDWKEFFPNLVLPNFQDGILLDPEGIFMPEDDTKKLADEIDITLSSTGLRSDLVNFALSCVGKFYYKYGGSVTDMSNPPPGLDCSGFVSYVLKANGLGSGARYNAAGIAAAFRSVDFGGNYDNLQPGTLIVKNNHAGGATTSDNHVVIYIGKVKLPGDSVPTHHIVECTTNKSTGVSGVQVATSNRMNYIANTYRYAVDPF